MADLPRDVLFLTALQMDKPTLRSFCQTNQKASLLCSDTYFRNMWINFHDQLLTSEQRKAIDDTIDKAVDQSIALLMEFTDYPYPTYIENLKENIRRDYRAKIGRDLSRFFDKKSPLRSYNLYNRFAEIIMDYLPLDLGGPLGDDFDDIVVAAMKNIEKVNKW